MKQYAVFVSVALVSFACASPMEPGGSSAPSIQPAAPLPTPPVQPSPDPPSAPKTADDFAPPKADLVVRIMGQNTSVAIMGLTPVLFDASASTGEGISYVIGFGDGGWTQNPWEVHAPLSSGLGLPLTATATVQDRFGRSSSTSRQFNVVTLATPFGNAWIPYSFTDCASGRLDQVTQGGASLSGLADFANGCTHERWVGPFTGTLSGDRNIQLVLPGGTVINGTVDLEHFRLVFDLFGAPAVLRYWDQ